MKTTALVLGTVLTLGSSITWSDHSGRYNEARDNHRSDHYSRSLHRDRAPHHDSWGRVIGAKPVYQRVRVADRYNDSCSYYDNRGRRRTSYTPVLLGAVIGSALGHRIGDAHGDADAAAIAGGVLGASFGRDMAYQADLRRNLVVNGPCEVNHQAEYRRQVIGYDVTYRFHGRLHQARMDHHPGEWVKLDVDVRPV